MLEWLKDILGDGYTEEIDKQVSNEIGKAYAPRADLDSANEAKAAAEAQLADANKTIAGYKDMDIDAIRQSAADWQTTDVIRSALAGVGLELIDHLIFVDGDVLSLNQSEAGGHRPVYELL